MEIVSGLHDSYGYGLWGVAAFNVIFSLMFVLSFLAPRKRREWRSMGLLTAFLVALFTEMFGFPLTVYMLASVLGNSYPAASPLSHDSGHLWGTFSGGWSLVFCNLGGILMITGVVIMGIGWARIHRGRGQMVTSGIYRSVRHPQYLGLFLTIAGALLQWPTIITLVMSPVLVGAYLWLARREEAEMEAQFGDAYRSYKAGTPAFFPLPRRRKIAMNGAGYTNL